MVRETVVSEAQTSMLRTCKGIALMKCGYTDAGLQEFNAAIKSDASNLVALRRRGNLFSRKNQFARAISDFTQIIELDRTDKDAYAARGQNYLKMWSLEQSLSDYNVALSLEAKNSGWLAVRAEVKHWLGDYKGAILDYEHAFAQDSQLISTFSIDRGLVLACLSRYEEAFEVYEQLPIKEKREYVARYNAAVWLSRWKSVTEAERYILSAQAALKQAHSKGLRSDASYGLGGIEAILGNSEDALVHLEACVDEDPKYRHWARHDAAWVDLRMNPRFTVLVD